jgi:uncharacterized protein
MTDTTHMRALIKPNGLILPWWKEPYVWLVVSGPLLVVVASFVTAYIAVKYPDPLVAEDYYKRGININKTLAAKPQALSLEPAQQARNHVMTPLPEQKGAKP